jgi:dienelactone hydrolase
MSQRWWMTGMSRRRWLIVVALVAIGLLWQPVLKPAGQATILLADIYSEQLVGTNLARLVTPEPRLLETDERFADVPMRVTYWRPGWGDEHPAIMIVPGAAPRGNDEPLLRTFGATLARAGYMVMLPEFPFLREGKFHPTATSQIASAYARVRAMRETQGRSVGTFGISVGGGMLLVAAGREPALREVAFVAILGGYYDIDTYLASVASRSQLAGGSVVAWEPSAEALERLPPAAIDLVPPADRDAVRQALAATSYHEALARFRALGPGAREAYDSVSPEIVWRDIRAPIYWIHDPLDTYEPLAEAEAARAAPRDGHMVLVVPRLVRHAMPVGEAAKEEGPLFLVGELWRLLAFTFEVLQRAG